jgi:hypothetical protein
MARTLKPSKSGKDKNYIDEISEYLKKNSKKGYSMESLKWALVRQGYPRLEVEKAIKKVEMEIAKEAPILEVKPKITYEQVPVPAVEEKKGFWKRLFG